MLGSLHKQPPGLKTTNTDLYTITHRKQVCAIPVFINESVFPSFSRESAVPSLRREQSLRTFVVTQEAPTPIEATGTEQSRAERRGEDERGGRLLGAGRWGYLSGRGRTDRQAGGGGGWKHLLPPPPRHASSPQGWPRIVSQMG